jgi:hypothetical protein
MNNAAKKLDAEIVEQPKASLEVVKKDEKEVAEVPSLEKRIQKVEDLSMLIEKWRKLTETRRNHKPSPWVLMGWVQPCSCGTHQEKSLKLPILR